MIIIGFHNDPIFSIDLANNKDVLLAHLEACLLKHRELSV